VNPVLSIDTNILFAAVEVSNPSHEAAAAFLEEVDAREDIVLSELVLLELYILLRNPAVLVRPLDAPKAAAVCQAFRTHPRWQVLGLSQESRAFHDAFWPRLATKGFARRRAFDWRMALSLLHQGVDELATVNRRDFEGFGVPRVWNPLEGG
jgi:toxin-antitoxin system PIN domain toxin